MYNNCDAQNQDNTQLHLQPAIIITVSESYMCSTYRLLIQDVHVWNPHPENTSPCNYHQLL